MTARNLLGDLALEETQAEVRDTLNDVRTSSGKALSVGNARTKFRDGFASPDAQPNPDVWNFVNDNPDDGTGIGHIINQGGDAAGSSYLRISMSPFVDNSSVWLTSKEKFRMPTRLGWGITVSQRIVGQEFVFGVGEASDTDSTGINRSPALAPGDVAITGSITAASNIATVTLSAGHPFRTGDRVILVGLSDTRLNVGPVVITSADAVTIVVPVVSIPNATYPGTGGAIRYADPLGRASNAFGQVLETASATAASIASRRNGSKARIRSAAIGTTVANTPGNWADSFVSTAVIEQFLTMDECGYRSFTADNVAAPTNMDKYHQSLPDEELDYRIMVRARNLDDFSKPIARITNVQKTASTVVTVTTDRPHGLTVTSRFGIYGVRDQTNFPNLSDGAIASVPTSTTFTIAAWGPSATISNSVGGVVFINHGGILSPGSLNFAIQSIARTNGVLAVTINAGVSGFIPGEFIHLWGMVGAGAAVYEGAYKIMRQFGSIVELAAPGPDFASITTGGALIRRTEFRLHFVRILDHTRHFVEILGGRGSTQDSNNAVPTTIASAVTLNASMSSMPPLLVDLLENSTTPLAANGLYSGATRDIGTDLTRQGTRIKVAIRHLAGIVPGSVYLEQSTDSTTWHETWRMPIPSDDKMHTFEVPLIARYYRWRFQNGTVIQTVFWFQTRRSIGEGALASEVNKTLSGFHITAVAGQAIAANTTIFSPALDLGNNHNWKHVRALFFLDAGTITIAIEQSLDGTSWYWTDGLEVGASGGSGVIESRVAARYVRTRLTTTANASTASRASISLIS